MTQWNTQIIVSDIILAVVINTSATLLAGSPLMWSDWYPLTCAALGTNIIAQLFIPTSCIAQKITEHLKDKTYRVYFAIFIENLIFVTIISLTMAFTQVGHELMIQAWSQTFLWLVLIGYITSVMLYHAGKLFFTREEH